MKNAGTSRDADRDFTVTCEDLKIVLKDDGLYYLEKSKPGAGFSPEDLWTIRSLLDRALEHSLKTNRSCEKAS